MPHRSSRRRDVAFAACVLAAVACGGQSVVRRSGEEASEAGGASCGETRFDAQNCGTCGNVCADYCSIGRCALGIALDQQNAACLAIDRTYVYWATADLDRQEGTLLRAPLTGGEPSVIAERFAPLWPCKLVVDETNAYFTSEFDLRVLQVPLDGSLTTPLATGETKPEWLAVDSTTVYFAESYGAIRRVPIDGGDVTTLADEGGLLEAFAIDDTRAFWTTRDGPGPLAGRVLSVPLAGGEITTLATDQGTSKGLAVDDELLYWTDAWHGNLLRMPKTGGSVDTLLSDLFSPGVVVLDGPNLYVGSGGNILRLPKTGGEEPLLISYEGNVMDLALSDTTLFYTTGTNILSITPK